MELNIENLKRIFKQEVDPSVDIEELKIDEDFIDFGIDSLDRSSVFLAVEDEFNLTIPDNDIENLRTMKDLLQYIENKT